MLRYSFFIFLIAFSITKTYAQTVDLQIFITNNKQPIAFGQAYLPALQIGATADSVGKCLLLRVPVGKHILEVKCIGYTKLVQSIEVTEAQNNFQVNLKIDDNMLNEIVVTGTMREMSKAESIVPVEVFTSKFFETSPTPSLFEAMQSVNGVRPQLQCNVCNTGDIHINGMEGPYTMVLIDGMPIVSGLSTVYGLSGIPNSMVQRVEIVKGPAAALYGSEAMGGIINVITKNLSNVPKLSLDISSTSYQEVNNDLSTGFRVGKKAHSLLSGNYFYFDKKYDINHDNFTDITRSKRASIFNKWSFDRKANRIANIAFRYVWENRHGGELQWEESHRGTDIYYGESIRTNRVEMLGSYQLPVQKEKIIFNFSANRHVQDSYYGLTKYFADQSIIFGQFIWDKKWGERHNFLLGVNQRYTYYDDNTVVTTEPQKHLLSGVFVQDEIAAHAKLKFLIGGRYDYSHIHKHIFSPRLSAKYDFKPTDALRVSVGNGFRVVNVFSEDHAALTGGRQVVFNAALLPEKSWNGNLNYTKMQTFSFGFVHIDASVFYTYYYNKIVADYLTDSDKIIYDNLQGFATNYGASLNTDWTFDNGIKAIVGVTTLRSYLHKNGTRQAQIQTPNFTGNYTLSYTLPALNIRVDFTGYVNSSMHLPILENDYRPAKSPFFNISNLQFSKSFQNGIEVYAGIKNIFNFYPKQDVIMRANDPFDRQAQDRATNPNGYTFDPSYNYAPIQGIRGFMGVRIKVK